jgi:AraC-like DNA-binding protein
MIHGYRKPRGPLSEFVELLWLFDGYSPPHDQDRMLPTATTELVIDLRGRASAAVATVAGPHSEHWLLDTARQASVIGVHFRPGGAFPFFGVPAGELHNTRVPLDALWGARAASVAERVMAAPSVEAKFDTLESALLDAACALSRHRAVAFALGELSSPYRLCSVAEVTKAVGLSPRRFIERFRDEVGMTPKVFARVQRFQCVVERVRSMDEPDWADIAAACGYFDQAHFIHDFRAFSGFTPGAWFALKSEHRNHVPLR